jgi:hypothetical protein
VELKVDIATGSESSGEMGPEGGVATRVATNRNEGKRPNNLEP